MNESKMSAMQRKKIDYSLRSGDPLPLPEEINLAMPNRNYKEKVIIRPGSSKRRMFSTIVNSGAYERDKFKPLHPRVDREMAKKHLQDVMTYGKEIKPHSNLNKKKPPCEPVQHVNRYEQLKEEIKDREEWLNEMERLGEGEKHRLVIQQQIEARLREIEKLKISETTRRSGTSRSHK